MKIQNIKFWLAFKTFLAALCCIVGTTANAEVQTLRDVQVQLNELGYQPGPADGIWGPRTEQAIRNFFIDNDQEYENFDSMHLLYKMLPLQPDNADIRQTLLLQISNTSAETIVSIPDYANDATIVQGIGTADLFGRGLNDVFLCGTTYRNYVDHPVTVIRLEDTEIIDVTSEVFDEVPTSNQCTSINFTDLNNDDLVDVVYAEAGMDDPPWTGTAAEIALNSGMGLNRITDQFEQNIFGIRSYAIAAGDLNNDEYGEVILSSGTDARRSMVIDFDENGIEIIRNKFAPHQWWDVNNATNMQVADLDGDGESDVFIGGNWASPSNRIIWSGLNGSRVQSYPDTFLGHYSGNWQGDRTNITGADVTTSAIADFDQDGDLDVVNVFEHVSGVWGGSFYHLTYASSSVQILRHDNSRNFSEILPNFTSALGRRFYLPAIIYDINHDSFPDIILNYWNKFGNWRLNSMYSATILINNGGLKFTRQDATDIMGYQNSFGMIFPLGVNDEKTQIMMLQPYSGRAGVMDRQLRIRTAYLEMSE